MRFSRLITVCLCALSSLSSYSQYGKIEGQLKADGSVPAFVNIILKENGSAVTSDENGRFVFDNIPAGNYTVLYSGLNYEAQNSVIEVNEGEVLELEIILRTKTYNYEEVVVTGTLSEMSKRDSPIPIEVYSPKFFKSNPSASVYEAMQNINGVRPQMNCSVCNTGDIHINGMEGAYTMVLIDGMPIVSGLSTVYGLFGIPSSLIERVEIIKGPSSTLYGSEAVGGVINVITKKTSNASVLSADVYTSSWLEHNLDLAAKFKLGKNLESILGLNYFNYNSPIDHNGDNFTDATLQNRLSVFNKWSVRRKDAKLFSFAARYVYEDRWGGEMNWNKTHRLQTSVYGESIYTNRIELFGSYQLPIEEDVFFNFSTNLHDQNSAYGDMSYVGQQFVSFGQLHWNKRIGARHQVVSGIAFRHSFYDDNSIVTEEEVSGQIVNRAFNTYLPGVFIQDEFTINEQSKVLAGMRFDHNSIHGSIASPRLSYKWNSKNKLNTIRLSFGNGYRVANVFTEDHAALTGAREVEFKSELEPEQSWNANLNYVRNIYAKNSLIIKLDASAFYTHFDNRIIADYDTDPNKVIYDNLNGYAVSSGISLNIDLSYKALKLILGGTALDVYSFDDGKKTDILFTEKFSATWNLSYQFSKVNLVLHYTGNLYSPMRLPLLGPLDPRPEYSPWWSIQNLQLTKSFKKGFELYAGIKNLLNWTPAKDIPFLIARANDPFDTTVNYSEDGSISSTRTNPYALSFDPSYIYAPMTGRRSFIGFRYTFK